MVVEVQELNTSIEVCIARDALREKPVGEKVIRNMQKTFSKDSPKYRTSKSHHLRFGRNIGFDERQKPF